MTQSVRLAVFGFGGLGKGMVSLASQRPDFKLVAAVDSHGYMYDAKGLGLNPSMNPSDTDFTAASDSMIAFLQEHGQEIDAIFMALPNLPVAFFSETLNRILTETPFKGVIVDALKRTQAVEQLLMRHESLQEQEVLYITGAGATPGFLTTIAAVAAHSFVEVLDINIHFGVGIANWEAYKSTVREDLIHLEGFDAKRVSCMSDEEIAHELESRNGLITLVNMEHADDIILELAGVCPRDRVRVGGLVDTRNAKKPVSTTVTVTGKTASGATGTHQFIVSDEATMVDNVCGPALGFMLRGIELHDRGLFGLMTSADLMPRFSTQTFMNIAEPSQKHEAQSKETVVAGAK